MWRDPAQRRPRPGQTAVVHVTHIQPNPVHHSQATGQQTAPGGHWLLHPGPGGA